MQRNRINVWQQTHITDGWNETKPELQISLIKLASINFTCVISSPHLMFDHLLNRLDEIILTRDQT